MTKAELLKLLEPLPDHMDIFMAERKTEFSYGLVNSGYVKEIPFSEDPDGETLATDVVFILDEE